MDVRERERVATAGGGVPSHRYGWRVSECPPRTYQNLFHRSPPNSLIPFRVFSLCRFESLALSSGDLAAEQQGTSWHYPDEDLIVSYNRSRGRVLGRCLPSRIRSSLSASRSLAFAACSPIPPTGHHHISWSNRCRHGLQVLAPLRLQHKLAATIYNVKI